MSVKILEQSKSKMIEKKYSNCPLKKRPVEMFRFSVKEEDHSDSSEPENLSTKPEDLSLTSIKAAGTPPPGLIPILKKERCPTPEPAKERRPHVTAFSVPKSSGGVLEPLNLNTPVDHHVTFRPTPQYPQFTDPYSSHDLFYHSLSLNNYNYLPYPVTPNRGFHEPLNTYPSSRESCSSPPHRLYTPPLRPVPHRPAEKLHIPFSPVDHCGLSPTSSSSSRSPPPATPEDLSSPGSVASNGSVGSAGMGSAKRMRKDNTPRYQCPDCNKSYSTYSGLSKHQQFHCAANESSQAKKSFSCKFCEKVYVSLGALKMHIRTHTLPCKCTVCGKAFSRPWLLQGHVRTHTGEKPFSCQHCGRAFADRSNLRAHLQTHSDVKKYSCMTCSKTFSRMSLLTKHADGGCPGSQHEMSPYSHHLGVLSEELVDI